jgi:hypothetical protein|tara:strand:+ start:311 stop:1051 length:741 start_codon:yes stop_codon:yes gene_type:complete
MQAAPTLEEFRALANVATRYRHQMESVVEPLLQAALESPDKAHRDELPRNLEKLTAQLSEMTLDEARPALDWLENQPAWAMALQAAGFTTNNPDWRTARCEKFASKLIEQYDQNPERFMMYGHMESLIRITGEYLEYVSGVASALCNYLSNSRVRAAIEGPAHASKIKRLLQELEASIAEDWVNPAVLRRLKRLIQTSKAIDLIDEHGLVDQPSSRRKDQALRTRLFAEDIVRLHYERFREGLNNR